MAENDGVSWDRAISYEDYKGALSHATNLNNSFRDFFNANVFEQNGYTKHEHPMGTIYTKPVLGDK